jgi:uncharacterized protein YkwD
MAAAGPAPADSPPVAWKSITHSPKPVAAVDSGRAPLHSLCGTPDASLVEVAARNVRRQWDGSDPFSADELAWNLRALGDPHVWPRSWSIAGAGLDETEIEQRLGRWVAGWSTLGMRRCGVSWGTAADGSTVVNAVAIDALADMAPLPTQARVGQWITLEGTMLVAAAGVKIILLGPRSAPKTVIGSLSGRKIRSTFSVDQPGPWLVQVLATVATGPRPVLEAMIFAGTAPPGRFVRPVVPGEEAAAGAVDEADAMLRMINAARAAEGVKPLVPDETLYRLAQAHSSEMLKARMVGHDVGGGDPLQRLTDAGVTARIAGENVASAGSLQGAHRAIWASPSHRGNVLLNAFSRVGVAVARGADGTVWVTELFAG